MDWIVQFFDTLLSVFPRLLVVRATHCGVKWRYGNDISALEPGLHWYWPLVSDVYTPVVARQALNLPSQVLMTRDKQPVAVGGFVVYAISDVIRAFGEKNWDVDQTVQEVSTAAIVETVMTHTLDELLDGIARGTDSDLISELTDACRKSVRQYGVSVHRCGLTDFSICQTFKLLGDGASRILPETE